MAQSGTSVNIFAKDRNLERKDAATAALQRMGKECLEKNVCFPTS